mmetsp:Transcript_12794/g.27686  ORF Transcript_12794/g.27686 Transcript_12794/m.27686 type:complete len:227 (-) Transcript_12794:154-834(-)
MLLANALDRMGLQQDALTWAQLSQQDVRVHGPRLGGGVGAKHVRLALGKAAAGLLRHLTALGQPLHVAGQNFFIDDAPVDPLARNVQLEHQRVLLPGRLLRALVLKQVGPHPQGHQAQPVRQHLVLDDGGVVHHEDVLNGNGGHLRNQDAAQCVGNGGVTPNHFKLHGVVLYPVDFEFKVLFEFLKVPGVVHSQGPEYVGRGQRVDMRVELRPTGDMCSLSLEMLR